MLRTLSGIVLVVAVGYGLYLGLLYTQQRAMMFPGAGRGGELPAVLPEGVRRVGLDASFGVAEAVFVSAPDAAGPAPALLYFHGNAETVADNIAAMRALSRIGVNVLLLEYPGYAGSDGSPSRETLMEVARLGHDWLRERPGVDAGRVVAMGRSVGSGPAAELAVERELAGLVLLSPFTSVQAFARGMGAPGVLVRDRFDTLARVADYAAPVLVFHGERDTIIPYEQGRSVAGTAPGGRLVTLQCGHNDCPYFDGEFTRHLDGFVRALGAGAGR